MDINLEDEQIKVGDTLLPGVFESMEITGDVKTDEETGTTKKKIVNYSYNPMTIRLNMIIIPDEQRSAEDKLGEIHQVFRSSPSQTKPETYKLVSSHAQARGVGRVMLMRLRSSDKNNSDFISVTLEFQVVEVTTISVQKVQAATGHGNIYTVKKGDTLSAIALAEKTTVEAIAAANNIANIDLIHIGQQLVIPAASVQENPPPAETTSAAVDDAPIPKVE
ncbi:hypothetical protein ET33_16525 [Paenibacillus tyrfis]|uniref:LysM domain-containing protein n=1 Tax=Paenibacillus tyrfis TaxID=1501230 RepID=A0A081NYA7_9BACL|nr:hypothetical protein ET33_16525 [Paenibacillus tyrfis]